VRPLQSSFTPPESRALAGLKESNDMLPPGPWRGKVRSDSAAYQQECLERWDSRGWQFAGSADMSRQLKRGIECLPEEAWQIWEIEEG